MSARQWIFVALLAALLLAGCHTAPAIPRPPASASTETSAVAEGLYGQRLTKSQRFLYVGPGDRASADTVTLDLSLASGAPVRMDAIVLLAALVRTEPGHRDYQLQYSVPSGRPGALYLYLYEWLPEKRTVTYSQGSFSGALGTASPRAVASGVTTASLQAAAAAKRLPLFRDVGK